ncbi:MAG: DUF805 domain-containing protein [Gammaproteobacteria bacterium]|jgi:uncharacterized membrane protein YhaH (DUF805 family)|uniref:DUF805 domain-containing protein n=1 Tax=SAR86 cluster bacterium TaxID=2030880 RepID=A0A368C505_9GAMM|nr:MAG: DUF805 domain-containing protein [SAR86 cluster bacterium]RPG41723.1 MAG: DUF805 domain-containing protein [Gammaproteobacteria bacterium TMED186]|tara:strand:- start:75 stop:455 length:381 start_codon:yes stop_codon:yes gene_type:complete
MNFSQAVSSFFARWKDFNGRSSRSEYWWATFFVILTSIFTNILTLFLGLSPSIVAIIVLLLIVIFSLFLTIASLALVVRRLHDTNKSGWWYLIIFTIIGVLPLLYWYCKKGDEGENRFGSNPLDLY